MRVGVKDLNTHLENHPFLTLKVIKCQKKGVVAYLLLISTLVDFVNNLFDIP